MAVSAGVARSGCVAAHLSIFLLKCSLPLLMESTSLSGLYRRRLLYFWLDAFLLTAADGGMRSGDSVIRVAQMTLHQNMNPEGVVQQPGTTGKGPHGYFKQCQASGS